MKKKSKLIPFAVTALLITGAALVLAPAIAPILSPTP